MVSGTGLGSGWTGLAAGTVCGVSCTCIGLSSVSPWAMTIGLLRGVLRGGTQSGVLVIPLLLELFCPGPGGLNGMSWRSDCRSLLSEVSSCELD